MKSNHRSARPSNIRIKKSIFNFRVFLYACSRHFHGMCEKPAFLAHTFGVSPGIDDDQASMVTKIFRDPPINIFAHKSRINHLVAANCAVISLGKPCIIDNKAL